MLLNKTQNRNLPDFKAIIAALTLLTIRHTYVADTKVRCTYVTDTWHVIRDVRVAY